MCILAEDVGNPSPLLGEPRAGLVQAVGGYDLKADLMC